MLISDIIGKIDGLQYAINGERPFQYFALNTQVAPGDVCVFAERSEMLLQLQENVRMVITTPEVAEHSIHASYGTCVVEDPRSVFFQLHNMSSRMKSYVREEFATSIGEGSEISNLASIAKNIRIGKMSD